MNQANFIKKWLPTEVKNCPEFIVERLGGDEIQRLLLENIKNSFKFYSNVTKVKNWWKHCDIPKTSASDFQYKWLTTPYGDCITSIRFIGGDINKPAIFLIHQDFTIDSESQISILAKLLKKEYAVFKPKRLRWFSKENNFSNSIVVNEDLIYVAEFLNELKLKEKVTNYSKVQLSLAKNLDFYSIYEQEYKHLLSIWENFEEMGQLETKESLQELMNKKLLFEIFVEKEWVGIIGANIETEKFLNGYVVYEEFLIEKFRGKELAAAVQQQFINQLLDLENAMLYGTIHGKNTPSLKTALKVGRRYCGTYLMANIAQTKKDQF